MDSAISDQARVVPASGLAPGAADSARRGPRWHFRGSHAFTASFIPMANKRGPFLLEPGGDSRGCGQKRGGSFHSTTSLARAVRFALNLDNGPDRMNVSGLVRLDLAADRLGCHVETLRIRVRDGRLPAVRGRHGAYYVSEPALAALPPLGRPVPARAAVTAAQRERHGSWSSSSLPKADGPAVTTCSPLSTRSRRIRSRTGGCTASSP